MDSHEINERFRLLTHRRYAEVVDDRPDLLEQARKVVDEQIRSRGQVLGKQIWSELLKEAWPVVRAMMLEDSPSGRLLRSSSPFSILIGVHDLEERRRLWRQAQWELGFSDLECTMLEPVDFKALSVTIDRPAKPTDKLREAFRRYRGRIESS